MSSSIAGDTSTRDWPRIGDRRADQQRRKAERRRPDSWLDRWRGVVGDLARLQYSHPMVDAVVEEIDGRMIRVGDRWLADFASCNYLGFDLEREIIDAIPAYLDSWGTHPSWSRLLGSPRLYEEIEERLTSLLGAEDTLVLPTITHIHMSVIPVLADTGTIFLDRRAHKTIYDGCATARGHGAQIVKFAHNDLDQLAQLLNQHPRGPRLICIDGVNSMTGNAPDLASYAMLARAHDALLYVDDAHGFGVIGEHTPDELCDYGTTGNSIVRHLNETYENIVLVGGFSKAYSSLLAFLALPTQLKRLLKTAAPPYLYSGPSPIASLATVIEGLNLNERKGDQLRHQLHHLTWRVLNHLNHLGIHTPNQSGYPIIEIPLADPDQIDQVGQYLFDHGIYVTIAAYPLVPRNEVGFRIQTTAANTDQQITHLNNTLTNLADQFQLAAVEPVTELRPGLRSFAPRRRSHAV
jgi:8-amino-7-oxononanoate synthase